MEGASYINQNNVFLSYNHISSTFGGQCLIRWLMILFIVCSIPQGHAAKLGISCGSLLIDLLSLFGCFVLVSSGLELVFVGILDVVGMVLAVVVVAVVVGLLPTSKNKLFVSHL